MSFCCNASVSDTTGEGPYFLMFGRDPGFAIESFTLPIYVPSLTKVDSEEYEASQDVLGRQRTNIPKIQARIKQIYDHLLSRVPSRLGTGCFCLEMWSDSRFVLTLGIFFVTEPNANIVSCTAHHADPLKFTLIRLRNCIIFMVRRSAYLRS